ncbi:hypothetical protein K6W36_09050 [Acetobacter senegalensis]|uniref:hypothetical protein n=1 Tax=Acetobacter senegalensis TaxID=446692 RepID=UPI001EDA8FB1|nr:hypothetical protein [Acetobacter senegalensis]MCG4260732.1 hypothetical protein [Acetobacter senegalensis]
MTTEDKVAPEDDTQVSEIFASDLNLFGQIKDKLLSLDTRPYPDYEMVMAWIEHAKEWAYYEDVSLHEVVRIAFFRCFRAYQSSKAGLPIDKFFKALDRAMRQEIDQLGIDFADDGKAKEKGGRPPRKEASNVMRLG